MQSDIGDEIWNLNHALETEWAWDSHRQMICWLWWYMLVTNWMGSGLIGQHNSLGSYPGLSRATQLFSASGYRGNVTSHLLLPGLSCCGELWTKTSPFSLVTFVKTFRHSNRKETKTPALSPLMDTARRAMHIPKLAIWELGSVTKMHKKPTCVFH